MPLQSIVKTNFLKTEAHADIRIKIVVLFLKAGPERKAFPEKPRFKSGGIMRLGVRFFLSLKRNYIVGVKPVGGAQINLGRQIVKRERFPVNSGIINILPDKRKFKLIFDGLVKAGEVKPYAAGFVVIQNGIIFHVGSERNGTPDILPVRKNKSILGIIHKTNLRRSAKPYPAKTHGAFADTRVYIAQSIIVDKPKPVKILIESADLFSFRAPQSRRVPENSRGIVYYGAVCSAEPAPPGSDAYIVQGCR